MFPFTPTDIYTYYDYWLLIFIMHFAIFIISLLRARLLKSVFFCTWIHLEYYWPLSPYTPMTSYTTHWPPSPLISHTTTDLDRPLTPHTVDIPYHCPHTTLTTTYHWPPHTTCLHIPLTPMSHTTNPLHTTDYTYHGPHIIFVRTYDSEHEIFFSQL